MIDYDKEYADYWSRPDRFGTHSFSSPEPIVRQILGSCAPGRVLDVGSGMGLLVQTLLAAGIDACGVDVTSRVVDDCNLRLPGRFQQASALNLPFPDNSFDTVISTDCLEHIATHDVGHALGEFARVTRRNAFLRIATTADRDQRWHLTIRDRQWWEERLFEAGFRKHPNYYRVNSYESLEHDPWQITILMEKAPAAALARYPSSPLPRESASPIDMSRITGRESDANLARYHLAGQYIRPGDTVLEIGSGSGAGLHLLRNNSAGRRFVGIDRNTQAVDYAAANFGDQPGALSFSTAGPAAMLSAWPDHSVDVAVAFNALDQQADPAPLLREIERVLIPGGRVILSVARPGDSSTNPRGLTYDALANLLGPTLLIEHAWQQHAAPAPKADPDAGGRRLRPIVIPPTPDITWQWLIATAIRDPLSGASVPYRETVFANLNDVGHPSTQYARWYCNPWVVHSMVHVGYRVKSPSLLGDLATRLLAASPPDSADYGAALCILAYQFLATAAQAPDASDALIAAALPYLKLPGDNPHVYRWQISLTFVMGQLHLKRGFVERARQFFHACSEMDPFRFSVHLATKTAESFFWSGWLALNQGDRAQAAAAWNAGVAFGDRLLARRMDEILINRSDPNIFDHGDGMREFAHAFESITQCVNGIHLLAREAQGRQVNWSDVQRTFRGKNDRLEQDLHDARGHAATISETLGETSRELLRRTTEVDGARQDLVDRTQELDVSRRDLITRTAELQAARLDLVARTAELDAARGDLVARTGELDVDRRELLARTAELDTTRGDLVSRTAELDAVRADLVARTIELDITRGDLLARTAELDGARRDLLARQAGMTPRGKI